MILGYPQQMTGMQPPVAQQQPLFQAPPARDQLVQALMNGPGPSPQTPSPTAGGGMPIGMLMQLAQQQNGQSGFSGAQQAGLTQFAPSTLSEYNQPIGPGMAGSP